MIFKALINHFLISVANSLPKYEYFNRLRPAFYRLSGIHIDSGAMITGPLTLRADTTNQIFIGKNTYLNSETRFGCQNDPVIIGDDVLIGPRVSFETASHSLNLKKGRYREFFTSRIVVENKVWIGAGVIVLQGVTIGEGAVVAAGTIVTRDVRKYTLVGGVPAREIRTLDDASDPGS